MATGEVTKRTWVHKGRSHSAYQFSIAVKGKQVRRQFPTKAEAETELDKFKDSLKRPALRAMTLGEAVILYLQTKAAKRSLSGDRRELKVFEEAWGAETPLIEITSARIAAWQVTNRGRAGGRGATSRRSRRRRPIALWRACGTFCGSLGGGGR
jgi:GH25 family lysozyme M1 (1,4-beta-N-acetylmuramidase)